MRLNEGLTVLPIREAKNEFIEPTSNNFEKVICKKYLLWLKNYLKLNFGRKPKMNDWNTKDVEIKFGKVWRILTRKAENGLCGSLFRMLVI